MSISSKRYIWPSLAPDSTHTSVSFLLDCHFCLVSFNPKLCSSLLSAELNVWMCECLDQPRYCSALPELILYAAGCRALAVLNATPGGFSSMQWLFQSSALGWAWMSVKRRREETPKSEEMGSIDSSAHWREKMGEEERENSWMSAY